MSAILVSAVLLTAGTGYVFLDKKDSKQGVISVKESKGLIQTRINKESVFAKVSPPSDQKKAITLIKREKLELETDKQWSNKKKGRVPEQKNEKPPLIIKAEIKKELGKENIIEVLELPKQDKIFAELPLALASSEGDKKKPKKEVLKVNLSNKKDIVEKKDVSGSKKLIKKTPVIASHLNKKKKYKGKKTVSNKDDTAWVLKQPKASYTIQLMVLSSRQSAIRFLEKNSKLKNKLKFFKLNKQGKSKYVLIYGSFKDTLSVSKGIQFLPKKIKKPWVRKFSQIQNKLKSSN
jgi:hypothetical protein